MVGGAAFGPDGRYARLLGAQAWAPDARVAADRLAQGPLPRPSSRQPIDDLPHLADQEYTLVSRTATQLVRTVFAGLEERLPEMLAYTDLQRQQTARDLADIVDFLAAALYVGEDSLLTSFVTWTADILDARGVPAASLIPALDLLAAELRDFPRATSLLASAQAALAAHLS